MPVPLPTFPAISNLNIPQGSTVIQAYTLMDGVTPADLTGWTALAQFRKVDDTLLFQVTDTDGIVIGTATNNIVMTISSTRSLAVAGDHRWDMRLVDTLAQVRYFVEGDCVIKKMVSVASPPSPPPPPPPAYTPSLDFSDARNSQYIALIY